MPTASHSVIATMWWTCVARRPVAAAVVFADLAIAYRAMQPLLEGKPPNAVHLDHHLDRWNEERRTLAAGVTPRDFHRINQAFKKLDEYIVRGGGAPPQLDALVLVETLEQGMKLAWLAGGMKPHPDGTNAAPDPAQTGSQSE